MLPSSSDEEEPLPPPITAASWISHASPPKHDYPAMDGPPSPPMALGVKKSTYVRTTTQIMKMAMRDEDSLIDINGKMMGDKHITDLTNTVVAKQRKLEILNAKMNNIGPKGAASIAKLISNIGTLEQVLLNRNRIQDEGTVRIASAIGALKSGSCLRMLRLSYNSIGDAGASALANAVKGSSISSLQLSMNRITDVGAIELFKALPSMKSIKSFYLNGNIGITDLSIGCLADTLPLNVSIRLVRLDDCSITSKGVQILHNAVLENSKCGGLAHVVTVHVDAPQRPRRRSLRRRRSSIMKFKIPDDVKHANMARKLIEVQATQKRAFTLKDIEDSLDCSGGGELDLRGHGMVDKDMPILCNFLRMDNAGVQTITTLNLSWNKLCDEGVRMLAKALRDTDIDIESLNLSYVATGPNSISSKTWGNLADVVRDIHTVKKFYLKGNYIGYDDAVAISESLSKATKLKTLKLGRNSIDDRCAVVIAKNIVGSQSCGVRTLDMGHNKIGPKGVVDVCKAFMEFENCADIENDSEKRAGTFALKLGGSPIMDGGAIAISKLVSSSLYLGMIDVACCGLTDKGILALSRAIKSNHENNGNLKCVFFDDNHKVSTNANESIAHEIYHHRSLIVHHSRLPPDSRKKIDSLRIKDDERREVEKRKKTVKANLDNPKAREELVRLQVEMRAVVARAMFLNSKEEKDGFTRWTKEIKKYHDEICRVVDSEMARIKGLTKSRTNCHYKTMGVRWELLRDIAMDNDSTKPHVQPVSCSLEPSHGGRRHSSLYEEMIVGCVSPKLHQKTRIERIDSDASSVSSNAINGSAVLCRVYAQSLASYFKKCCEDTVKIVNDANKISDLDEFVSSHGIPYLDFDDSPENLVKGKRLSLQFGSIKGIERAVVKAEEKRDEMDEGKIPSRVLPSSLNNIQSARILTGLDYVLDWLRATVCAQDPYLLSVFFAVIQENSRMFRLQRVKNKFFDDQYEENIRTNVLINLFLLYPPDEDTYRSSKLHFGKFDPQLAGKPLTSCEIQLTLNDYLTIKGLMHTYYEIKRSTTGALAILKHPIFMNDFTLEPQIPDVVREIKAQEASIKRVTHRFIQKLKRKARERKESDSSLPSRKEEERNR